ncbi:MAG TPA: hypothetical protein VI700_02425 [Thermoanaerobaculaceae bacterium]|nr:hypothetical protein [Thermoanaerobaculaceae bacterium]
MKRSRCVLVALGLAVAVSVVAASPRAKVVHRGPRTKVIVPKGFPLRRPLPPLVVVAPPGVAVKVAPLRYLPPIVWAAVVVVAPTAGDLAWEDSQALEKEAGWTDFTLNAAARGRKLFIQIIDGEVRLNFAEVVFENGDTQVVDFAEVARGPGLYSLLDFADGRRVDHVRVLAWAQSETARVALRLLK